MTEQNTPSVYTTPETDGDDVLGHMKGNGAPDAHPTIHGTDSAPGAHSTDKTRATDTDDVEGHLRQLDEAPGLLARDKIGGQHEEADDVEGHLAARDEAPRFNGRLDEAPAFRARDKAPAQDDTTDDAEGHLLREGEPGFARDAYRVTGEDDDVEGHKKI